MIYKPAVRAVKLLLLVIQVGKLVRNRCGVTVYRSVSTNIKHRNVCKLNLLEYGSEGNLPLYGQLFTLAYGP